MSRGLESLFVEPWRTCNLACTYCYAGSDPSHKKKVDPEKLAEVLKNYPFKRASVFGGEPLLDPQFVSELKKSRQWDSFFFSTNALLLDKKATRDLLAQPKVHIQISLEPQEWSCRVTAGGEKQIDLIKGQLKLLRKSRPSFRVTVPTEAPHVPLKRFLDELAAAVESWDFSISYWVARAPAPTPWLADWIKESHELMRGDDSGRYAGKLPGCAMASYFRETGKAKNGFRFYNCNAGYGSVSIGPDNKLHGCHELAVVEDQHDLVSSFCDGQKIDEAKRSALVYKWSSSMKEQICGDCAARYLCGGVCFVLEPPHSACRFIADMLPLVMAEMVRYNATELMDLTSRSEARCDKLFSMREGLAKEVNSEKCKRLLSGELPLAEAVALGGRLLRD